MYLSFQSVISFVPFTFQNIFYLCVFKPTSKTSHLITFHIVFNIAIITYCFYLIPILCLLFHTDTGHLRSCGYAFYKFFQLNDEFCLGHDQMQNPMTSSHRWSSRDISEQDSCRSRYNSLLPPGGYGCRFQGHIEHFQYWLLKMHT